MVMNIMVEENRFGYVALCHMILWRRGYVELECGEY